ncbi:MAG: hypothetical protein ACK5JH_06335 [Anaerocolumna sp.]
METFKIFVFEYLLGYCLQSFAVVFGIYTFNRQKIIVKSYMLASILVTFISFLVRTLPISFGIHIIINILFLYLICVILLKMPAYTSVRSALLVIVLILSSEMIVTAGIMIFKGIEEYDRLMNIPMCKLQLGVSANVVFSFIVLILYYFLMKKGDRNRKIS